MSQVDSWDFPPSPNPALVVLPAINDMIVALHDCNSGPVAPSPTVAGMLWFDTSAATGILKQRNLANDGWLSVSQHTGRNLIINGSGRINQRAYVSGTATVGANQFTLDRWFVITSGQNLTFTGTEAGRVMTAPAGGVAQVIEGANIVGGDYVINWTGTATCTVGGVARAKGDTFTLTANTNVTVKFSNGTFSDVQLESGSIATPFERVDIGLELAKCQRYYMQGLGDGQTGWPPLGGSTFTRRFFIQFPVAMRAIPTVSGPFAGNIGALTIATITPFSARLSGTAGGDVECVMTGSMVLDAELIA